MAAVASTAVDITTSVLPVILVLLTLAQLIPFLHTVIIVRHIAHVIVVLGHHLARPRWTTASDILLVLAAIVRIILTVAVLVLLPVTLHLHVVFISRSTAATLVVAPAAAASSMVLAAAVVAAAALVLVIVARVLVCASTCAAVVLTVGVLVVTLIATGAMVVRAAASLIVFVTHSSTYLILNFNSNRLYNIICSQSH